MSESHRVSKLLHFDHKGNEMIAVGLFDGRVIIKQAETLLSDDTLTILKSVNVVDSEEEQPREQHLYRQQTGVDNSMDAEVEDKVTYIGFFTQPNRIIFGSKEGFITIWNITKGLVNASKDEALNSFKMPPKSMQKVV